MKISIVTVSYNSEKTIRDTLESVYNQNYQDIEYIIIDGNSKDKTLDVIKEYEIIFKNSEKQFRWISENDNGIYDAINKGISMSSGDIVGILNSDDYFYDNEVIFDIANKFEVEKNDCLYGNIIYIDPDTKKTVRKWISREFENGLFEKSWTPGHPSFYCKKCIYDCFGLYRTDFKIAADVELMYRFIEKNHIKSSYYNRYIVTMRQGGVSSSGLQSTITITKEMKIAFEENGGKFNLFKYLFYKSFKIKEFLVKSN